MRSASRADDSGTGSRLGSSCDRVGSTAAIAAERHDALATASARRVERGAHPVAPERERAHVEHLGAAEFDPDARGAVVVGGAGHRGEPVAKGEPTQPQPLLLEGERALLVALLLVELRLEVVEQQVPAHARTLLRARRDRLIVLHRRRNPLTRLGAAQYGSVKDPPTSPDRG